MDNVKNGGDFKHFKNLDKEQMYCKSHSNENFEKKLILTFLYVYTVYTQCYCENFKNHLHSPYVNVITYIFRKRYTISTV